MAEPDWFPEAKRKAQEIENALNTLKSKYAANFLAGEVDFRYSKEDISGVKELFKPRLLNEDRKRLWDMYESVRNDIHQRKHKQYEDRKWDSEQKKDYIKPLLQEAMTYAEIASSREDFAKEKDRLQDILNKMRPGWSGFGTLSELFHLRPGILTKEDNEYLWEIYIEVQQKLKLRRAEISNNNYDRLLRKAESAEASARTSDSLKDASNNLKAVQSELKGMVMEREQQDSVRRVIQTGFDILGRRSEEYRRLKEIKSQEWRARQLDGIARLEGARSKTESYADGLRNQIGKLQAKVDSAWSDNYRSTHQSWLNEAADKLRDVERSLAELDRKIHDAKDRLY